MANYTIYGLAESQISLSNSTVLSGFSQGDGSHLVGQTLTLNSNAWEQIFIADNATDANFADNDNNQTLDGAQTVFGTPYASGTRVEAEYQFVAVDQFGTEYTIIAFNLVEGGGRSYATVEGLAFLDTFPPVGEQLFIDRASEGPSNSGGGSTPANTYATPPCFAPRTMIATPDGARAAEEIRPGDWVLTKDDGPQPVLWVSRRSQRFRITHGDRPPVLIKADAFGPGRPQRDLVISAQHRVLVGGDRQLPWLCPKEALVAAVALLDLPRIRAAAGCRAITWSHFAFRRHALVLAEGIWTESMLVGPEVLKNLSEQDQMALRQACHAPSLRARRLNGPPARRLLNVQSTQSKIARRKRGRLREQHLALG